MFTKHLKVRADSYVNGFSIARILRTFVSLRGLIRVLDLVLN